MRIEKFKKTPPTFGWTLNQKQAELIRSLPKEQLDVFEKKMLEAPMDATKEASNVRDGILKEALKLARKLRKKK